MSNPSKRTMSLLIKVLAQTLSVLLLGTGILCAVLMLIFNTTVKDEIRHYIEEMGYRYLNRARLEIAGPISSADTIATVIQEIINPVNTIKVNGRFGIQEFVKDTMANFSDVYAIGVFLEPDVIGKDSEYGNAVHSTAEGRFSLLVYHADSRVEVTRAATEASELEGLPYYRDVKKNQKTLVSDPLVFAPVGSRKTEQVIAVSSPIRVNNVFAGTVVFFITLETLDRICFSDVKIFDSGYMHLISPSGIYTYAGDDNRIVMTSINNRLDKHSLEVINKSFAEYVPTRIVRLSPTLNTLVETEFIPFRFVPGGRTWILAVLYPIKEANAPIYTGLKAGILLSILIVLITGILIYVIIRNIVSSFKELISLTNVLSSGDFSVEVPKRRLAQGDEIGDMARSFSTMTGSIKTMLGTIKSVSEQLLESGLALSANAEETNGQVRSIGSNIERVAKNTDTQAQNMQIVSGSIQQISRNIEKLDLVIVNQASAVVQSSAGIEEMIGNISSINTLISKITGQFGDLVNSSQDGVKKQELVESKVQEIVSLSENLNETNAIIAAIAAQTNLLAMNAAIESAHAGEAGKGFAVVSDEIRKLAEQATEQSKEVAKQLKSIRNGIESIVETSGETRVAFDTIAAQVDITNTLVDQVHSAMEEQSSGSRQILEGIRTINTITQDVKTSAGEMRGESHEITSKVSQLEKVSAQVHTSMSEVSSSVGEIDTAANAVLAVAIETRDLIGKVKTEVERFKV